ncbi:MAG: methyl-accepting chemotaxis protein [Polyangiaceae bacterium]
MLRIAVAEGKLRWWEGLAPRLLGAVITVIASLSLILSLLATDELKDQLVQAFESKGEAIALAMAATAEQNVEGDPAVVQGAVDANKVIFGVRYIYVTDERGRPYVHTFAPVFPPELARVNQVRLGESLGAGRRVKIAHDVTYQGSHGKARVMDIAAPVAAGALGVVHVGMNSDEIDTKTSALVGKMIVIGCALTAAGGLTCFLLLSALVLRPVRDLTHITRQIVTDGDLSHDVEARHGGELGELARTFTMMVRSLREILVTVVGLVDGVAEVSRTLGATGAAVSSGSATVLARVAETSSSMGETFDSLRGVQQSVTQLHEGAERASTSIVQISATNEDVASNVEAMAQSVERVGASVDHMATSMQDIARDVDRLKESVDSTGSAVGELDASIGEIERNADQTAKLSDLVSADARDGCDALERTLSGLGRIQTSSAATLSAIESLGSRMTDIGGVIDVIGAVAEQTNLLALNASIIAAQVGEPGAGFAIVANNVKELAQRTAASTVEVAELVHDVQALSRKAIDAMTQGARNVEEGVRLGDETAAALRKILDTATKSTAMAKSIARATVEQTKGTREINGSVRHIAAAVDRIAVASSDQAGRSEEIIKSAATMRTLTQQVRRSSHEQAEGSRQAIRSIDQIHDMASRVNSAQKQQTERTAPVLRALETIRGAAEGQNRSMTELGKAIDALARQSEGLRSEVSRFRLGGKRR